MQTKTTSQTNIMVPSPDDLPSGVRIAGLISRTLFLIVLTVATVRVASPQNEQIWSAYETPGDLVRMLIGLAVCLWLVVNLFKPPKDPEGYRTWIYLSPLVPLAMIGTFAIW